MSTRYSTISPRSTLTRLPTTSSPVMPRSVRAARAIPSSTASRKPSGDEAMISVTRATAIRPRRNRVARPGASSALAAILPAPWERSPSPAATSGARARAPRSPRPGRPAARRAGEHVVDDPLGFLVDPRSVIVTDTLAARLGVTTGATLPLRTPHGIETFTVRGVLPPGGVGRAFGGNLILMDVVGAQLVLGEDGLIDQVDVTLEPGVRVEDVEQRLHAALPAGLEAIRPARRGEQIERYLASFQTLLSGLSGLALLAAIFVVGSAVATSVAARRRA